VFCHLPSALSSGGGRDARRGTLESAGDERDEADGQST